MFHRFLIVILKFGLLGSVALIYGRCINGRCDNGNLTHQSLRSTGFSPRNCHYHVKKFCSGCRAENCNVDENVVVVGDSCWKCCCKRLSLTPNTDDSEDDVTVLGNGCGSSSSVNSKSAEEPDISRERDGSFLYRTSSEIGIKYPRSAPCLPSSPCPTSAPCPSASNFQRFTRSDDAQQFKESLTLPVLPEGVPIIPSPQLDFLISGGNVGFNNIHLSKSKPLIQKSLIQVPSTNNFLLHDCCTRCSGANCIQRNSNTLILRASTPKNRRNRGTKCESKQLRKLMIANIKKDPSHSKRAIQRAAEEKFSTQFNVICSKGNFSYVTRTTEYCEVSNEGIVCYAFRIE